MGCPTGSRGAGATNTRGAGPVRIGRDLTLLPVWTAPALGAPGWAPIIASTSSGGEDAGPGEGHCLGETSQVITTSFGRSASRRTKPTAFVEVVHEIVEEQITDDISVVAPPLIVGRVGCPVLDRLLMLLEDPRWTLPDSVDVAHQDLAAALRLPPEVVEAYPVVGRFGLLAKSLDRLSCRRRGRRDSPADARHLARDVRRGARAARDFEVLPTGSKEAFRGWLLDRFDLLGRFGFPRVDRRHVRRRASTAGRTSSPTAVAPTWSPGSPTTVT